MSDTQSSLVESAMAGDVGAVDSELQRGADVDQTEEGRTALHNAAAEGLLQVVKVLLYYKANPTRRSKMEEDNGGTALHLAAEGGHLEVMEELLQAKANVEVFDSKGRQASHRAASRGHRTALEMLHSHGADMDARDAGKATPLHFAAFHGDVDTVRWLVEAAGVFTTYKDKNGRQPKDVAKKFNNMAVQRFLKNCGGGGKKGGGGGGGVVGSVFGSARSRRSGRESSRDRRDTSTHRRPLESPGPSSEPESLPVAPRPQDIADAATAREDKPLHQPASLPAGMGQPVDAIGSMPSLSPPDSPHNASMDRRVQLLVAAIRGNTEEVKRCVKAGASLEARSSSPGLDQPPLHLACRHGHLKTAKYLLCAGASTIATSKGLAAVHWASSEGHIKILKLLKESGCDLGLLADNGSTALHFALMEKQSGTAYWLVLEGASLEALNKRHQTPLDLAEDFGSLEIKRFLKKTVKDNQLHEAACDGDTTTLQQLISLDRVDVNTRSHAKKYRGWQAVHRAAEEGRVQVVSILLQSGAVADARTSKEGPMAVHLAAQGGHSKVVKLLLKVMGDRTREALVEGRTLIHLAAIGGHLDVLDFLYQHGFDLNAATVISQQTPLHLACECENEAAARWLLAAGADFRRSDHRGFLAKDVAVEAGSTRLAAYLKKTETTWNKITTPTKNSNPQGETERPGRKWSFKGANWNPGHEGPKKILPKGLQSVGNTSYLNAVLQCLYHTTNLTVFLLGEDWRSHKSGPSSEYGGVIVERYRQVMAALLTSEAQRRTLPAVLHLKIPSVGMKNDNGFFRTCTLLVVVLVVAVLMAESEGQRINCRQRALRRRGICIPRKGQHNFASRTPSRRPAIAPPLPQNPLRLPLRPSTDPCRRSCSAVYQPVCGSDGVSYGNPCEFEASRCRNSRIQLKGRGPCNFTF